MKKKLIINTFLLSLGLEIIYVILFFVLPKYIFISLLFQVPLFLAVSLLATLFLVSSGSENPNKFIRIFMLSTFIKFVFYVMILFAFVMMFRAEAVPFIISFFILFVVYLIFDVVFLLNNKA